MQRHGLTCEARHRALGDALVLRDLWFKLNREIPAETLKAATLQAILGVPKLPAHLPPQLADELPDGPGAYRFFGEDGALLYVGRSHSLRTRVLTQFGGGTSDFARPQAGRCGTACRLGGNRGRLGRLAARGGMDPNP